MRYSSNSGANCLYLLATRAVPVATQHQSTDGVKIQAPSEHLAELGVALGFRERGISQRAHGLRAEGTDEDRGRVELGAARRGGERERHGRPDSQSNDDGEQQPDRKNNADARPRPSAVNEMRLVVAEGHDRASSHPTSYAEATLVAITLSRPDGV